MKKIVEFVQHHFEKKTFQSRAGFTLIMALLVVAALVSVATAVTTIAFRDVRLSISARESTKAFFAADAGLECLTYWDLTRNIFDVDPPVSSISCLGRNQRFSRSGNIIQVEIFDSTNTICASVTLEKETDNRSVIESRGYNTCEFTNPRLVERALRLTYE